MSGHMRKRRTEHYKQALKGNTVIKVTCHHKDGTKYEEFFSGESKPTIVLRGMRKREGFTQKELADELGTIQSVIAAMETGLRAIGKNMAHRLAEILKADYRIFL